MEFSIKILCKEVAEKYFCFVGRILINDMSEKVFGNKCLQDPVYSSGISCAKKVVNKLEVVLKISKIKEKLGKSEFDGKRAC